MLGTVAWFTASRLFQTDVGNFSVVEIDGSLDCEMNFGVGTIKKSDGSIEVINSTNTVKQVKGTFVRGDVPTSPVNGQLWYDSTASKVKKYDSSSSTWVAAGLTEDEYYIDSLGGWNIAGEDDAISPVIVTKSFKMGIADPAEYGTSGDLFYNITESKMKASTGSAWGNATLTENAYYALDGNTLYKADAENGINLVCANPAVLTHGSVDHTGTNEGHAYVIDNDSNPSNPSFQDKKLASKDNWLQKGNVDIDTHVVDVYNAVSWTMTFSYKFAGDTTPVAVYLDLHDSVFTDNQENNPDFRKPAGTGHDEDTKYGFRIGFYNGSAETYGHDVVWGNHDPLSKKLGAKYKKVYAGSQSYETGDYVVHEKKLYKANDSVTSTDWDTDKGKFDLVKQAPLAKEAYDDVGGTYAVGDICVNSDKTYSRTFRRR